MLRVFLIDDHAGYRAALRSLLDQHDDIEVVAQVSHGNDALDQFRICARVEHADASLLVLLEPRGKEMDGIETAQRLLVISPVTAIMALSDDDEPALVAAMQKAGCRGYALKSDSPPELVRGIRQVAAGREWLSPPLRSNWMPSTEAHVAQPERHTQCMAKSMAIW